MNQTPIFTSGATSSSTQNDAYLVAMQKKKEHERQKKRRGRNNYNFPEEDDDVDNSKSGPNKGSNGRSPYDDYSDDDDDAYSGKRGYSNQEKNRKADPFANAEGPRKNPKGSYQSGNMYGDEDDYPQPQRTRGDPFGGQGQQKGFPQGGSRRKDPFSRNRGFNDDNDDDD